MNRTPVRDLIIILNYNRMMLGQIFRLKGGTGNQLFIYFASLMSHKTSGKPVYLETSALYLADTKRENSLSLFKLPAEIKYLKFSDLKSSLIRFAIYFTRKTGIKVGNIIYTPTEVGYCDTIASDSNKYAYIDGYFQTWRYFHAVIENYPDWQLQLKQESEIFRSFANRIEIEDPIIIHVRRGDYKSLGNTFGLLSQEYFINAIKRLISKEGSDNVWAFSDDPEYVRENFKDIDIQCFPELEASLSQEEVLVLMSKGKRLIISNSTFSWWAAAFAGLNASVIAPTPWFRNLSAPRDLLPHEWLTENALWSSSN